MEKQDLKLDGIEITPELIACLRSLQDSHCSEKNVWLNSLVSRLTGLTDLIVKFYTNDPTAIQSSVCMESLSDIHIIKDVLMAFAATNPEEQQTI